MIKRFLFCIGVVGSLTMLFVVFAPNADARCCVFFINDSRNPSSRERRVSCFDESKYFFDQTKPVVTPFNVRCKEQEQDFIRGGYVGTFVSIQENACTEVTQCDPGYQSPTVRPRSSSEGATSRQNDSSPISLTIINPFQILNFTEEGLARGLGRIAAFLLSFTGILAFLMFVWGGFQWLTSSGDPEKVKSGVDTMKWAAIGVILAFGSFALLTYFLDVFRTQVNPPEKPAAGAAKTK